MKFDEFYCKWVVGEIYYRDGGKVYRYTGEEDLGEREIESIENITKGVILNLVPQPKVRVHDILALCNPHAINVFSEHRTEKMTREVAIEKYGDWYVVAWEPQENGKAIGIAIERGDEA